MKQQGEEKKRKYRAQSLSAEALGGNMVCKCLLGNVAPKLSSGPNKLKL